MLFMHVYELWINTEVFNVHPLQNLIVPEIVAISDPKWKAISVSISTLFCHSILRPRNDVTWRSELVDFRCQPTVWFPSSALLPITSNPKSLLLARTWGWKGGNYKGITLSVATAGRMEISLLTFSSFYYLKITPFQVLKSTFVKQ